MKCNTCYVGMITPLDETMLTHDNALHAWAWFPTKHSMCLGCYSKEDGYTDAIAIPLPKDGPVFVRAGNLSSEPYSLQWFLDDFRRYATYQHYKGATYTALDLDGHIHDTQELAVSYVSHDRQKKDIRLASDFFQHVVWRGKIVPRFARLPVCK